MIHLEAGRPVVVGGVRHVELENHPPLELGLLLHALLAPVRPISALHHLLHALLPLRQHLSTSFVERLVFARIELLTLVLCVDKRVMVPEECDGGHGVVVVSSVTGCHPVLLSLGDHLEVACSSSSLTSSCSSHSDAPGLHAGPVILPPALQLVRLRHLRVDQDVSTRQSHSIVIYMSNWVKNIKI